MTRSEATSPRNMARVYGRLAAHQMTWGPEFASQAIRNAIVASTLAFRSRPDLRVDDSGPDIRVITAHFDEKGDDPGHGVDSDCYTCQAYLSHRF